MNLDPKNWHTSRSHIHEQKYKLTQLDNQGMFEVRLNKPYQNLDQNTGNLWLFLL